MVKRLIVGLVIVTTFVQAGFALEFSMTGEFEWRYRYFGRTGGGRDLFGDMNLQNTTTSGAMIGFAGPNYYRGYNGGATSMETASNAGNVRIVRGGFSSSESDAFVNDQRLSLYPKIKINSAISIGAIVDFAGFRQKYNHRDLKTNGPLERYYEDRLSRNAYDTSMIPSISQAHLLAHTPWGIISAGQKDLAFGGGGQLALNTRGSALAVIIPYGPFRIIPALWVAKEFPGEEGYSSYNAASALPAETANPDSAGNNKFYGVQFFTYSSGPLEIGALAVLQIWRKNGAKAFTLGIRGFNRSYQTSASSVNTITEQYWGSDESMSGTALYLKYNNGRFFANAEAGFTQADAHYVGDGHGAGAGPRYTERSYAFGECGFLAGPTKLSFMFGWSPGDPLNDNNPTKVYAGYAINYQAMLPYQYLMFYTYGGGNDAPWNANTSASTAFTNDENGQMSDAYALAARLDYAVAANLNVWGSYLWAHRVEQNGFYAGWKNYAGGDSYPSATYASPSLKSQAAQAWKAANGFGANANPYVDDGHIGWEIGVGVDWKLLEGLYFRSRYAYWQPGKWFDQAYQAVGPVGTGGYLSGKSAINAFEGSVEVNF